MVKTLKENKYWERLDSIIGQLRQNNILHGSEVCTFITYAL